MRLRVGAPAPLFSAWDISGRRVALAQYVGQGLLLSFNLAAMCPLCNIRIFHLIERSPRYQAQGLSIIAFFESSQEIARAYLDRLRSPFPIVADLQRQVYALYGLETSLLGTVPGSMRNHIYREARERGPGIADKLRGFLAMDGRKFRMPADFLIGPDLPIRRAYYAHDASDFLSFAEVDAFAASLVMPPQRGPILPPPAPIRSSGGSAWAPPDGSW
jgi:thioredoxin-dependent peroxiredoxin